jgi:hypothetical protein
MNVTRTLRFTLRCVLCLGARGTTTPARGIVPEHTVVNGAVHLEGVNPDNPIIYDNDWWFDVPAAARPPSYQPAWRLRHSGQSSTPNSAPGWSRAEGGRRCFET